MGRRERCLRAAACQTHRVDDSSAGRLTDLLARLWPGRSCEWRPLAGGITNRNFLVDVEGERYVLRMAGKDTHLLGIDRRAEAAAARMAAAVGVGPEVVAALEGEGCLVTRFIDGSPIPAERMREQPVIAAVATSLAAIHAGSPLPSRFDVHEVVARYARTASEFGVRLPEPYAWAAGTSERIRAARGTQPVVPCHNDLLNANFIDDGTRLWIVDWEYAGMGDPMFDLGNFSVKHDFGIDQDEALLTAYAGRARSFDVASIRLMRFMGAFFEAMWGVVQQGVSELDVDFAAYAADNFDRLRAIAADPRFEEWLERAAAGT